MVGNSALRSLYHALLCHYSRIVNTKWRTNALDDRIMCFFQLASRLIHLQLSLPYLIMSGIP